MLPMKDHIQKSGESLRNFSYDESFDEAGKNCLSDPNAGMCISNESPLNEQFKKSYDEIDYIEELLSDESKNKMQMKGISLRSDANLANRGKTNQKAAEFEGKGLNADNKKRKHLDNETKSDDFDFIYKDFLMSYCSNSSEENSFYKNNSAPVNNIGSIDINELFSHKEDIIEASYGYDVARSYVCDEPKSPDKFLSTQAHDKGELRKDEKPLLQTHPGGADDIELKNEDIEKMESNSFTTASDKEANKENYGEKKPRTKKFVITPLNNKEASEEGILAGVGKSAEPEINTNQLRGNNAILSIAKLKELKQKNMVKCPIFKYRMNPFLNKVTKEHLKHKEIDDNNDDAFGSDGTDERDSEINKQQNEIFEEIEKRLSGSKSSLQNDENSSRKVKKFYFENSTPLLNIETCLRANDLRLSTLYGKMNIKEGKGKYRSHWFQFKGSNLSYFDSKKNLISQSCMPNESAGDMIHPEKRDHFLVRKSAFNIFESKVYLVKNKVSCPSAFRCTLIFRNEFPELLDITEDKVVSIRRNRGHYVIDLNTSSGLVTVKVPTLEFALENGGTYIFFRVDEPDVFTRWLLAISFRQGRQICEIE